MLSATSHAPFHINVLRRGNVWYSVQDGSWDDPATWMSNGLAQSVFTSPQINDTVIINHNVLFNPTTPIVSVKHVIINTLGVLSGINTGKTLTVYGNFQCFGLVDFTGSNTQLRWYGLQNRIDNFIRGTSTIYYDYNGPEQPILSLDYYNLQVNMGNPGGTGFGYHPNIVKLMEGDLTVAGTYVAPAGNFAIDVGEFDVLIEGLCDGTLISSGNGTYYFRNGIRLGSGKRGMIFTGSPYVEIQGTLTTGAFVFGNGTVKAVADVINNATTTTSTLVIAEGVLFRNATHLHALVSIDGLDAGSTFKNEGTLTMYNLDPIMTTGVFDYMPTGFPNSTMHYFANGAGVLHFNTYNNLSIQGTGTKTLTGNLICKNLTGMAFKCLDLESYDATISGISSSNTGQAIIKTGPGHVLFLGSFNASTGGNYDFRGGNPTVEWQGGWLMNNGGPGWLGTGVCSFTTNNQTVFCTANNVITETPVVIQGPITVTWTQSSGLTRFEETATLEGSEAGSTLDWRGILLWNTEAAMMNTGTFLTNTAANTVEYTLSGNVAPEQQIRAGTYRTLRLNTSIGGPVANSKKLLGNVTVVTSYTLTAPATVDLNGFTLTTP